MKKWGGFWKNVEDLNKWRAFTWNWALWNRMRSIQFPSILLFWGSFSFFKWRTVQDPPSFFKSTDLESDSNPTSNLKCDSNPSFHGACNWKTPLNEPLGNRIHPIKGEVGFQIRPLFLLCLTKRQHNKNTPLTTECQSKNIMIQEYHYCNT